MNSNETSLQSLKPVAKLTYLYLLAWDEVHVTRPALAKALTITKDSVSQALKELEQESLVAFKRALDGVEVRNARSMSGEEVAAFIDAHEYLSVEELAQALSLKHPELYQRGEKENVIRRALENRPRKGASVLHLAATDTLKPEGFRGSRKPLNWVDAESVNTKVVFAFLRGMEEPKIAGDVSAALGIYLPNVEKILDKLETQGILKVSRHEGAVRFNARKRRAARTS